MHFCFHSRYTLTVNQAKAIAEKEAAQIAKRRQFEAEAAEKAREQARKAEAEIEARNAALSVPKVVAPVDGTS